MSSSSVLLAPPEIYCFSVPLPVCLLGERQELLGLGSVAVATDMRVLMSAVGVPGGFHIELGGLPLTSAARAQALIRKWQELLGQITAGGHNGLNGLTLQVDMGQCGFPLTPDALLRSPAFAVGAVCAVKALWGGAEQAESADIARCAAELMSQLHPPAGPLGKRFYAEALVCARGGARYVEPTGEAIDIQELVPPDSLLLAFLPRLYEGTPGEMGRLEELGDALQRVGATVAELVASSEEDMERFFSLASKNLDERQTGILYGLLRGHQLVTAFVEHLSGPVFDFDILAEMCDEENDIMEHCFGFTPSTYERVRREAAEAGALGAKCSYGSGTGPFLLIIAPGRREFLLNHLARRFEDAVLLPVNVDPSGIRQQ